METIAAICKVPMIRNGKRMIKIGSTVKITDQIGKPAAPVTMETISITTNARYPTKHILVTCALRGDQEKMKRFTIAGVTNEVYYTALLGYPPTIITSDRVVKAFAENSITLKRVTPHSCYFSDELGVSNFFIKIQNWCLLYMEAYGTIKTWKKISIVQLP